MPNHITNQLTVEGDYERIFAETQGDIFDESESLEFDFNKIVPMPKELNITSDGLLMWLKEDRFNMRAGKTIDDLKKLLMKAELSEVENFAKGVVNLKKYGYPDWYEWCCDNWGTKWNAYSVKKLEPGTIQFQTAWAAPIPIFEALSAKYPAAKFKVKFADEDVGSNIGDVTFQNGRAINGRAFLTKEDKVQFACEVLGRDFAEYMHEQAENS